MSLIQQNMGAIYDGSQRLIAPVLNSTTATQNWAVGQEFILDGNLYKVTTAIPSGSQIVVSGSSANCELADTVTEQINDVIINKLKTRGISVTKENFLANNIGIYYNSSAIKIDATAINAGTANADLQYSTNYFVKLGSISDENVRKIYPKLSSTATIVDIASMLFNETNATYGSITKGGIIRFVRASSTDTTWHLCSNLWYKSGSSGTVTTNAGTLLPFANVNLYSI